MTGELRINVQGGAKICVPDDLVNITTYVLLEQESWFEDELAFAGACLSPGQCAVDVGANFGVFTSVLAARVGAQGRVLAFEPSASTAAFLRRTLEANRLPQVELVRAALSNRAGHALLEIGSSPELNALTDTPHAGRATERVASLVLDEVLRERGVQAVGFLKVDVEGHELQVGQGARRTLQTGEPLVLFEIRHGESVEFKLFDYLQSLGFEAYRLLPGPGLLVPFRKGDPLDDYQLNLFACTPARARSLREDGLLAPVGGPPEPPLFEHEEVAGYLRGLPGWGKPLPSGSAYADALKHYALLQTAPLQPEEKFAHLARAERLAEQACSESPSIARLLTHARLAADMGHRRAAIQTLSTLAYRLDTSSQERLEEPCLPPHPRCASLHPAADATEWVQYAVVETLQRRYAFSSVFQGPAALTALEYLRGRRYYCAEMERRRQLLRMRSGRQHGPEPHALLIKATPDNLNPWFWSGNS